MIYVIEHLDPAVFEWTLLEYTHINQIIGNQNLIFTNVKQDQDKLLNLGEVRQESIVETKIDKDKICVLDPAADITLKTKDKEKFTHMVVGGVLGNHPMDFRTKSLISQKLNCETRNLGIEQMSTDTAVFVTKKILDGAKLQELKFLDNLEIEIDQGESVCLPYRYVVEDNIVVMPNGFIEFIKKNPGF